MNLYAVILLLTVALALCAASSLAEAAFFSLTSVRLRRMKIRRSPGASLVRSILARPRRLLSTLVVGNAFALTAASSLAAVLGLRINKDYGPAAAAAAITVIIFIFAEALPKTAGVLSPERAATLTSPFVRALTWLLYPVNRVLLALLRYLVPHTVARPTELRRSDLTGLLAESAEDGVLDEAERAMIERVVNLRDVTAGEIATPRTKVFALDATLSYEEGKRTVAASPYARIPVFAGDLERITGILYAKDLLLASVPPPRTLGELARPAHFVPASLPAVDLFLDFVRYRTHIALVVDEYGALDGLVTMNDVLLEIAGGTPQPVRRVDGRRFVAGAETELEAFNDIAGTHLHDDDAATLGGYVINRLGKIPRAGDEYRERDVRFVILAAAPHRLYELMVETAGGE